VWLGNGSGGFTLSGTLSGTFVGPIVTADFDLDGNADLAAKASGNSVVVYYGDGKGGFSAPVNVTSSVMTPTGPSLGVLAVSDLNGDGTPDLVFTGPADMSQLGNVATALDIFISSPNRGFAIAGFGAAIDAAVNDIAVIDINNDHKPT
jgi:hypothetical protein